MLSVCRGERHSWAIDRVTRFAMKQTLRLRSPGLPLPTLAGKGGLRCHIRLAPQRLWSY